MNDKDYRRRLDEILDIPEKVTQHPVVWWKDQAIRLEFLCVELIEEIERLNRVIELNNATMKGAL